MAGNVTFEVDANTAKAVNGVMRIVSALGHGVDGFKKMKDEGSGLEELLDGMKDKAHEVLIEFLSYEGIKSILEDTWASLEKGIATLQNFHKTAAGAESLPRYLENIPAFIERSSALSTAFAQPIEDINKLREGIAIHAPAGTPDDVVKQYEESALRTQKFTGADPNTVFQAERSLRATYPQLTVGGAEDAIEMMRQRGQMTAAESQEFFENSLPTFGMLGTPLKDVEALGAMISRSGGDQTATGRGLKQFLTKLPELTDPNAKGGAVITHGQSLEGIFGDAEALLKSDPSKFVEKIGPRAVASVAYVAQHPELLQQSRNDIDTFQPGALSRAEEGLEQNEGYKQAHQSEVIEQAGKNLPLQAMSPEEMKAVNQAKTASLGASLDLPQSLSWMAGPKRLLDFSNQFVLGRGSSFTDDIEAGNEFITKQQAISEPGGPQAAYLKARGLEQTLEGNILGDDRYANQPKAYDALNVGSHALWASNQAATSGDYATAAKELNDAIGQMRGLLGQVGQVVMTQQKAADTHLKAAESHQAAAKDQKQATDSQKSAGRRIQSY